MTDFGRRVGQGDMLKATYDPNDDGVIAVAQTEADMTKAVYDAIIAAINALLAAHKTQHQTGGTDEVDATALVGRKNYVDQGDPSGAHYMTGTFTTDGNWHDLDLSSKVPAGATVVHLLLNMRDNLANVAAEFRKNGNSNAQNIFWQRTQVANISIINDFFLACDANRVIEYRFSNTTWSYIQLQVRGWLI